MRTVLSLAIAVLVAPGWAQDEPPAAPAGPLVAQLLPTAVVSEDNIVFANLVADLTDEELAAVAIGPAPLPGLTRTITRDQVELRLARAGYGADRVRLEGVDSVVVRREARRLSRAEIEQALAELVPEPVLIDRLPPRAPLPTGPITYRLRTALPAPLPDLFTVGLDVMVNGQVADRLSIVVRRPAPPTPVTPVTPLAAGAVPAIEPVADATPPPPAPSAEPAWRVKRGDRLTVVLLAGTVKVSVAGEAREDGKPGDTIQVQVVLGGKRKLLAARLTARDQAQVEL